MINLKQITISFLLLLLTSCSTGVGVKKNIEDPVSHNHNGVGNYVIDEKILMREKIWKEEEALRKEFEGHVQVEEEDEEVVGLNRALLLTYHNFAKGAGNGSTVEDSEFYMQMEYLSENKYNVISLSELFDILEKKKEIPPKTVIITIDDGWISTKTIALPILKKFNFPAELFVYTDIVGKSGKFVTWDDLIEMEKDGINIQCHSKSHANLRKYKNNPKRLRREIGDAKKIIEEKTGAKCEFFAYPYGKITDMIHPLLDEYGYRGAVTINMGFVEPDYNKYRVRRTSISGEYDMSLFEFIMDPERKPLFYRSKYQKEYDEAKKNKAEAKKKELEAKNEVVVNKPE